MPGQSRQSNAAGAFFSVSKLSKKLYAIGQPLVRFRQFCEVEEQFGKREGSTLLFDKILNLTGSPLTNGRRIAEGQQIPQAGFNIVQGTVTALPSALAVPWTEEFEVMSEFDVRSPIQSRLVDDMTKAMDFRAYDEGFNNTAVMYTPTGTTGVPSATWTTSGSIATAATRDMQVFDLKEIIDALKLGVYGSATSAPVPYYDGVNYNCVGSVYYSRAVRDDPDWETPKLYGEPEAFFSGEIGRLYNCRHVEENHILSTLGTTSYKGEAFFFGAETVKEIVVTAEEIRVDLPDDHGRLQSMCWYYLGGFSIIWSYNSSSEPDNRIVSATST